MIKNKLVPGTVFYILIALFVLNGYVFKYTIAGMYWKIMMVVLAAITLPLAFSRRFLNLFSFKSGATVAPLFFMLLYLFFEFFYNLLAGNYPLLATTFFCIGNFSLVFVSIAAFYGGVYFSDLQVAGMQEKMGLACFWACILSIPVFFLNIYQYLQTNDISDNPLLYYAKNKCPFIYIFLIPFLFVSPKKKYRFLTIALILLVFISLKRSPLVAFGIAVVLVLLFEKKVSLSQKVLLAVSVALGILLLSTVFSEQFDKLVSRFDSDLEAGQDSYGSGRTIIWELHYLSWLSGDWMEQLFGFKLGSSQNLTVGEIIDHGISAHSTFIGMGYTYGLICLILIVWLLISMGRMVWLAYRIRFEFASVMLYIYIVVFVSMFTEFFPEDYPVLFPFFLFYFLGGIVMRIIMERVSNNITYK